MYDPLANAFANSSSSSSSQTAPAPAWPATSHNPFADGVILPKPSSPKPPGTPEKPPHTGLQGGPANPYGKEPQVYGQPPSGMVSPQNNGNGKFERGEPYLRVRITGLDRNRRDILVRLDAQTNLPNFTGTTYRNVSRSYAEFQRFAEQITYSNPQTIVPALPLAQTSAPSDEEDDRLVKVMLQRWFTRISEDPILMRDEEMRSFIESDFGYQPTVRAKRKTSSGFSLLKRGAPDEDEELITARLELTRLEGEFFDAAKAVDKLSRARKALAATHTEMGNRLINVATAEAHQPLAVAFRKLGRVMHSFGDVDQAQAASEVVILGDSLGYQGLNAKSAKETLQQRSQVLEEYQSAVKASISKRRNIERLKSSSNIRPERVDEALEELEEATKYEQILAKRVDGISQNLHKALHTHSRHTHEDITHSLIEHVRTSVLYEKQLLKDLESLRQDFASINKRAVDVRAPVTSPQASLAAIGAPIRTVSAPDLQRTSQEGQRPPIGPPQPSAAHPNGSTAPNSPQMAHPGRLDGTQSMFVGPSASAQPGITPEGGQRPAPLSPSFVAQRAVFGAASSASAPTSPLAGPSSAHDPLGAQAPYPQSPGAPGPAGIHARPGQFGSAGQTNSMARSMYVQPTRSRLDAREAAAKLANFL
ncbi:Vacuolar protein sorting-associated protein 17 [Tulasnella sp. UAMH 9824]|nr:Vacuolar protein sorting-associated protein 17 [Tulasnella sp. UAMH 9824]